jgi:putative aldouronate transport system substrate-binding protein
MDSKMTRREFLHYAGIGAGAIGLASCGVPPAAPTQAPAAATNAPQGPQATPTLAGPEPVTLPIVKQPLTLTYWVETNPNAAAVTKNYNEIQCYVELEKRTGIHVDFQQAPVGQGLEQFNLMIASGKYPDVIEFGFGGQAGGSSTAPGGPAKYIKDGVILRLNDLIDKYAPNYKKVLADHPDWRKQVMTDEGDFYGFPFIRGDPFLQTFTGPILRGDWLEKLGLKYPTTIDEWYTVLKAFKEKDPNGNGKADEVPFTPFVNPRPLDAFRSSGSFIGAWGIIMDFYQDKGVVKHGALQPEMKEFLKVMAQWYKEGLIDPDFVSMDRKMLDSKATSGILGALVGNAGSGIGSYMGLVKGTDPKFKLVGAPYPVLKAGQKPVVGQKEFEYMGQTAAISTANKRVVETIKWLDYAYSPEGQLLFNFGVEGVSYKMDNGYPRYTDAVMKPEKISIAQAMCKYFRGSFNGPFVQDKRYMEQYYELPEQREAVKNWYVADNAKWIPRVTPTQDESKRFATISNDVTTRRDEVMSKIIMGQQSVETWDQVVEQLKQMGIEEAIKIQQGALDRFTKRGSGT